MPADPELKPQINVSVDQNTLNILKQHYPTVVYGAKVIKVGGRDAAFVYLYLGNDNGTVSISELASWRTVFSVRFDKPYLAYYTATMFGFYATDIGLVAVLPDGGHLRIAGNIIHGANDAFFSKYTNVDGSIPASGFDFIIREYHTGTNNRYATIIGLFVPVAAVEY